MIITIINESSVSEGVREKGRGWDIGALEGGQRREQIYFDSNLFDSNILITL